MENRCVYIHCDIQVAMIVYRYAENQHNNCLTFNSR